VIEMTMHYKRSKFKILAVSSTIAAVFSADNSAWANPRSEALLQQALKETMLLDTKDAALKHIDQALSIDPKNPVYWRVKAQILQGLEESEKALPCITKSIDIFPQSAEAYGLKADILVHMGKTDEALLALDQALKITDHPYLRSVRAKILKSQGKFDLAEKELDKVIKAEPNNLVARSARAKAAAQIKHWQKAIDDLTFALKNAKKKNYSYYEDLLARAGAYTETKQYEKAIADCKAGIEGQPELPQFHVALLKVYTMNGNKAGAASERKALSDMDVDYQAAKNFGS
jgi:tetratricopeptide (TPR) repeat protein